MGAVRTLVVLVHAGVAALWLGSMAYSLFVVQPKLARMVDAAPAEEPQRTEDAQRILAHGNRWPVSGLVGVLWVTGLALALLTEERSTAGWTVLAVKAVLLAGATGLFWWVSWRGWPRRVFALPAELPGLRRRFRLVALTMFGLVGAAYALGVVAGH
jgi:Flp pilus assembly protein TadB